MFVRTFAKLIKMSISVSTLTFCGSFEENSLMNRTKRQQHVVSEKWVANERTKSAELEPELLKAVRDVVWNLWWPCGNT